MRAFAIPEALPLPIRSAASSFAASNHCPLVPIRSLNYCVVSEREPLAAGGLLLPRRPSGGRTGARSAYESPWPSPDDGACARRERVFNHAPGYPLRVPLISAMALGPTGRSTGIRWPASCGGHHERRCLCQTRELPTPHRKYHHSKRAIVALHPLRFSPEEPRNLSDWTPGALVYASGDPGFPRPGPSPQSS